MKVKRYFEKVPWWARSSKTWRPGYVFEATFHGHMGLGDTPAKAIADARHEYLQFKSSEEVGKCAQGRFHK